MEEDDFQDFFSQCEKLFGSQAAGFGLGILSKRPQAVLWEDGVGEGGGLVSKVFRAGDGPWGVHIEMSVGTWTVAVTGRGEHRGMLTGTGWRTFVLGPGFCSWWEERVSQAWAPEGCLAAGVPTWLK